MVSWLSNYPEEQEFLFYGRRVHFRIVNIFTTDDIRFVSHENELKLLNIMQQLLKLIKYQQNNGKSNDKHDKYFTKYSKKLFNGFVENKTKICIQQYNVIPSKLRLALLCDSKSSGIDDIKIKLTSICKLMPKITDIIFTELNVENIAKHARSYIQSLAVYIDENKRNKSMDYSTYHFIAKHNHIEKKSRH